MEARGDRPRALLPCCVVGELAHREMHSKVLNLLYDTLTVSVVLRFTVLATSSRYMRYERTQYYLA